jgi:hypothetical protein
LVIETPAYAIQNAQSGKKRDACSAKMFWSESSCHIGVRRARGLVFSGLWGFKVG